MYTLWEDPSDTTPLGEFLEKTQLFTTMSTFAPGLPGRPEGTKIPFSFPSKEQFTTLSVPKEAKDSA
jgi:hypothetical protein